MKKVKFQELSTEELLVRVRELKEELFHLRFQLAVGQLQNPMRIKACKHDIARCKTILRQRQLQAQ